MTGQPWNVQSGGGPGSQGSGIAYGAPVRGVKAMVSGTEYPAGRGILIQCTGTGDMVLTFADGTTLTLNVLANTVYVLDWSIKIYTAGTATATVTLLV